MQVNSSDQSLSSLLGQMGPRRANAAQPDSQVARFQQIVVEDESRRAEVRGDSASAPARSRTGLSVPQAGTSTAAAGPPATGGSSQCATPQGTPPPTPSSQAAASPFAPSGPQEPSPAAPWPMTVVTPSVLPELAQQSKSALAGAMTQAGLDPSQFRVSYWEELVWYPGGNYTNQFLTVQGPDGLKTDFDAKWTLKTPWVTAEILKGQVSG